MRVRSQIIWEYFEKSGEKDAKCKSCDLIMKGDRTNNLKTHLERVHNIDFAHVNTTASSSTASLSSSSLKKRNSSKKDIIKVNITKKDLFRSYVGLVTEDNLPFKVLNSPNMRTIVDPICDGLSTLHGKKFRLNSENCRKAVSMVADKIRESIKIEINKNLISLKIDSATRLNRTVFGVCVQFISDDEVKSRLLGMVPLKGAKASYSKKLVTKITDILNSYGISLQQVVSVTSDNGANMIKASKLLSETVDEEREHDDGENLNEEYLKNIEKFERFDESSLKIGAIQHCRCAAHTCQLCALDVSKEETVKSKILECRNLTKFIRLSSNGFKELFEMKGLKLPGLDCATRWGSTYNMINDLKSAKNLLENLDSVSNKSDDENFQLNEALWSFIEAYTKVFAPLQKTIVKFQEEQLNYGDFFACWLKCKLLTKKVTENPLNEESAEGFIMKSIGKKLLRSFETRENKMLNNEVFNACLFLDPRFQHLLDSSKRSFAIEYLLKIYDQLKRINPEICSQGTDELKSRRTEEALLHHINENNEDELLNNFLLQGINNYEEQNIDLRTKLERFTLRFSGSETNILEFWKSKKNSDPDLYALAMVCFAVPPTQVTVERAFSALRLILSDLRNQLKHEIVEDILLIKLNKNFLNDAVQNLPMFEETTVA